VPKVRVIRDGETLRVGPQLAITALHAGHTPGSTTWTWESCEGSRCLHRMRRQLNAVVGPGFTSPPIPRASPRSARTSRGRWRLPCDVIVSVHPDFTDVAGKLARRAGGDADAFVNPQGCRSTRNPTRVLDRQLACA
jgi:metallo-beta-lactamase class B